MWTGLKLSFGPCCIYMYISIITALQKNLGNCWFLHLFTLTLRSDRLWDGAWVTQTVRIHCTHNEKVHSVGEETRHCVFLLLHLICNSLPCASHWLTVKKEKKILKHQHDDQSRHKWVTQIDVLAFQLYMDMHIYSLMVKKTPEKTIWVSSFVSLFG